MKKILLLLAALGGFFVAQNARATCSNYTTYASGQTLTAASLNSLQTNYTDCVNAVLDGDTFTGNMIWNSGVDAIFNSDAGTTRRAAIFGDSGYIIGATRVVGTTSNCEINYAAGTITISGWDGTALSATNPCIVNARSNTNGVVVAAYFTANVTTTDGAASDTDANLFGITEADWASAMPIFVGVIYNGTTPYFGFSRKPLVVSGAAATDLCQEGDQDCDGEGDFLVMITGLTLASWVNLPITQVAWLSATYATTGGAWTFAETAYTGFNSLFESLEFAMPTGQMGAATGAKMIDNGGTAPIFTTQNYFYTPHLDGYVDYSFYFNADGGTDGVGAVTSQIPLPYSTSANFITRRSEAYAEGATTISGGADVLSLYGASTNYVGFYYQSAATTSAAIQNAMFSNGARQLQGAGRFRMF